MPRTKPAEPEPLSPEVIEAPAHIVIPALETASLFASADPHSRPVLCGVLVSAQDAVDENGRSISRRPTLHFTGADGFMLVRVATEIPAAPNFRPVVWALHDVRNAVKALRPHSRTMPGMLDKLKIYHDRIEAGGNLRHGKNHASRMTLWPEEILGTYPPVDSLIPKLSAVKDGQRMAFDPRLVTKIMGAAKLADPALVRWYGSAGVQSPVMVAWQSYEAFRATVVFMPMFTNWPD